MTTPRTEWPTSVDFFNLKISSMLMKISLMVTTCYTDRSLAEVMEKHIKEVLREDFSDIELAELISALKALGDTSAINVNFTTTLLLEKVLQKK